MLAANWPFVFSINEGTLHKIEDKNKSTPGSDTEKILQLFAHM